MLISHQTFQIKEPSKQVIMGKEEEDRELNRGGGTGEKVRKEMLCSGGLERILYALSVTCRSVPAHYRKSEQNVR